jgi:hypothetical protein
VKARAAKSADRHAAAVLQLSNTLAENTGGSSDANLALNMMTNYFTVTD